MPDDALKRALLYYHDRFLPLNELNFVLSFELMKNQIVFISNQFFITESTASSKEVGLF